MRDWQKKEAKARLLAFVGRVRKNGKEIVGKGRSPTIVRCRTVFERLSGRPASLLDFMQRSPLAELPDDFEFWRDRS